MERLTHSPFTDGFVFSIQPTLKIWKSRDPEDIERVCRELFRIWERPIARCAEVLVNLTIGNGEHILKWTGSLDDTFEWDRYKGHNNAQYAHFSFYPIPLELFMDDPPAFTYRDLLTICRTLRRVCANQCGKPLRLKTNFEPGPEFCESAFRYVEHPEVLNWQGGGHGASIAFDGVLHADSYHYAAYPEGIPEGEPFGRFLGKQMRSFCETFGYEAVSLSNGLGFGTCPWTLNGRNFDGEHFGLVDYTAESESMCAFWRMFLAEAPYPVSAQGTNWPVAADLATKCIPLREFYDRRYLSWPLGYTVSVFFNDSVGFAMQALLSRSSHADGFTVGFYLHDMWYPQDPFDDYPYDGEAFDLYIPASTALVRSDGTVTAARGSGVGANDEHGDLCPQTAVKYLPHFERAFDHLPDEIGPLTLLYPFDEFHEAAADPGKRYLPMLYFTDCYTATAIDAGLPLNGVCSSENLAAALAKGSLDGTVLYTPMPVEGAGYVDALLRHIEDGGGVLFFGSERFADPRVKTLLGLSTAAALDGELTLEADPALTAVADEPLAGGVLFHAPADSDGGVSAVASGVRVLASVTKGGERRAYAVETTHGKGKAVWLRGSLPFSIKGEAIEYQPKSYVSAPRFPRYLLSRFGWTITETFTAKSTPAQIMFWRHENGLFLTGYAPDNTLDLGLSTPEGAPLFVGMTCELRSGVAYYHIPTTPWKECRIFVKQQSGRVRCRHIHMHKFTDCVYSVTGLEDAELLIRVPRANWSTVDVQVMGDAMSVTDKMRVLDSDYGIVRSDADCTIRMSHVTGRLQVNW